MKINFKSEVSKEVSTFDPIPEGRYTLTVEKAELKQAKSGSDMISLTLVPQEAKYAKRKLWHNLVLTDAARKFVYIFLKAAKSSLIEKDDVSPEEICKDLVGKSVSAYLDIEDGMNGKSSNKLSNITEVESQAASNKSPF